MLKYAESLNQYAGQLEAVRMPLIPNYLARFRTRSQSTTASSSSTAPSSLDPPTPAAALLDDYQVDSSVTGSSPNYDGDAYLSLASRAASAPGSTKSRKSRSSAMDNGTDHTGFQSEKKTRIANSDENESNFISRILSSYSNAPIIGRKRSFTVPLTGVLSSSSPQVPQTPISSPSSNGSYYTPISGSSPQGSAPSGSDGSHKCSSPKHSPGKSLNPRRLRPNQESYKHDSNPSGQHDPTASPNTALSGAMSQSGKDGIHQGRRPRMTETTSNNNTPLVTAPHTQTDTFFTPPRTSTPPPPQRSPNSYRGRQPPNTYPPRSRSRHTFDGGARPVFLSEGHSSSGSSVLFPSFRRMSESLNKITNSGKPRKEAQIEDVFTDTTTTTTTTQNKSSPTGKTFVLSEQRRLSADWSSIEAIRGNSGGAESWPSSVSREMVRLSLKEGNTAGGDRDDELGSMSASPGTKSLASDVDVNPKNPTLFGSIGEDKREFFRATGKGRRGHKVRSSLTQFMAIVDNESTIAEGAESSSAAVTRNNFSPTGAHVNDSESRSPIASKMTKGRSTSPTLNNGIGGSSIPFVSVTAPTPIEPGLPQRLSSMSDPGPGLGSDSTAGSKRKIADAEDEPVSSSLTASASAPLNGNANKNSVRSILLTRSECKQHLSFHFVLFY